MTLTRRALWLLILVTGIVCSVWSAWLLFNDANRVVSALIAAVVALAVARPVVTNLFWALSLLFWKPGKLMEPVFVWLTSPRVRPSIKGITLAGTRNTRELLERVVRSGAPEDRDAAVEALKRLPVDDEPATRQQARDAQAMLEQSPILKAWKGLDGLASIPE